METPEVSTFDSGNQNVSVCTSIYKPALPGHWIAETYIAHGLWLWVRVNDESQAMRALRRGAESA